MLTLIIRGAVVTGIAGTIIFLIPAPPTANAGTPTPQAFAKGDRLSLAVKGSPCAQSAWPNYEQNCLFDKRRSADEVRKVVLINLDKRATPARDVSSQIALQVSAQ
jgi:hypothetical protein